jgi:hypothetical protein
VLVINGLNKTTSFLVQRERPFVTRLLLIVSLTTEKPLATF